MRLDLLLLASAPVVLGAVLPRSSVSVVNTSIPQNFTNYAPVRVKCPSRQQWVRPANGLSTEETAWVQGRKAKVLTALNSYLSNLTFQDFDVDEYLCRLGNNSANVPTISIMVSGGAWASALTGTGALLALDAKFPDAVKQRTGGLLQSATYLAGLSGGSWPVMGLATNNFPSVTDMVSTWYVNESAIDVANNTAHRVATETVLKQIAAKYEAGFNLSFADYLGRAVSYEFVAGANGGMATTVSGIAQLSNFVNHEMPLPMWQARQSLTTDQEEFGIRVPYANATLYEWSPFEFGAWGGPSSFFPTQYLGTHMVDGSPVDDTCIVGFDRASFSLGLAADAWNFWWIEGLSNGTLGSFAKRSLAPPYQQQRGPASLQRRASSSAAPSLPLDYLEELAEAYQKFFGTTRDEAMYASLPNPFATKDSVSNSDSPPLNLTLLDESEGAGGQSLPLWSQIQPARKVDFIVAWDNDEDAHPYNWENGTNLYNTYIYATNHSIPFPIVPPPTTFINNALLSGPTFFGCNANQTNTNTTQSPIILYLPNAPYSSFTNYTGFQSSFSNEEMAVILTNGFNYLTQGNSTLDGEWPECLACAAIDRSLARVGMARSQQCERCMARYCWDGTRNDTMPTAVVDLPLKLDPSWSFAEWNASTPQTGLVWGETNATSGSNGTKGTERRRVVQRLRL